MDGGVERSSVVTNRVTHAGGDGSALAFAVQMSLKDKPEGGILVPLSRGSVRPVDARKFAGVRLDMRGAGRYLLVVNTLAGEFTAPIEAKEGWSELRRSEEPTSELQSLMRLSYAVLSLKHKKDK